MLLGVLVEASLFTAALAYLALAIFAFSVRDGVVWNVFRWKCVVGFLGALSAGVAAHHIKLDGVLEPTLAVALWGVFFFRTVHSVLNAILAFHLNELLVKGKQT